MFFKAISKRIDDHLCAHDVMQVNADAQAFFASFYSAEKRFERKINPRLITPTLC